MAPFDVGREKSVALVEDIENLDQPIIAIVATGLVAVPNRYMHSAVETVSLDDIDHAADLLAPLVVAMKTEMSIYDIRMLYGAHPSLSELVFIAARLAK